MVLKSIQRSFRLLPAQFRFGSAKLLVGIIINSLFDVIGLAAILPVLAVILKEGFIFENPYVFYVYDSLNFSSEKSSLSNPEVCNKPLNSVLTPVKTVALMLDHVPTNAGISRGLIIRWLQAPKEK